MRDRCRNELVGGLEAKILKGVSRVTSATFCLLHVGKWVCCVTSKQNDSYARVSKLNSVCL